MSDTANDNPDDIILGWAVESDLRERTTLFFPDRASAIAVGKRAGTEPWAVPAGKMKKRVHMPWLKESS
jgi:hypothetical protein